MATLTFQQLKLTVQPFLGSHKKKFFQFLYKAHAQYIKVLQASSGLDDSGVKSYVMKSHSWAPHQSNDAYKTLYRDFAKKNHPDAFQQDIHKHQVSVLGEAKDKIISGPIADSFQNVTVSSSRAIGLEKLIGEFYQGLVGAYTAQQGFHEIQTTYDIDAAQLMFGSPQLSYGEKVDAEIAIKVQEKINHQECSTKNECLEDFPSIPREAEDLVNQKLNDSFHNFLGAQLRNIVTDGQDNVAFLNSEYYKVHGQTMTQICRGDGEVCAFGPSFTERTNLFKDALLGELLPDAE